MSDAAAAARSEAPERDRNRGPERVGALVGGVFDRLGVTDRVERAGVARDWDRLVGPHIAHVTVDAVVSGRTLFVEVVNAAWLTELNMMRHELLRRINAGRRAGRIEKIVFVQAGKARGPAEVERGRRTHDGESRPRGEARNRPERG